MAVKKARSAKVTVKRTAAKGKAAGAKAKKQEPDETFEKLVDRAISECLLEVLKNCNKPMELDALAFWLHEYRKSFHKGLKGNEPWWGIHGPFVVGRAGFLGRRACYYADKANSAVVTLKNARDASTDTNCGGRSPSDVVCDWLP